MTVASVAPPGGHLTVSPHAIGQLLKMPELTQKGFKRGQSDNMSLQLDDPEKK